MYCRRLLFITRSTQRPTATDSDTRKATVSHMSHVAYRLYQMVAANLRTLVAFRNKDSSTREKENIGSTEQQPRRLLFDSLPSSSSHHKNQSIEWITVIHCLKKKSTRWATRCKFRMVPTYIRRTWCWTSPPICH